MRLQLDYFDQNESFGSLLPRSGTVERFLKSSDGGTWALFRFDNAIEYRNRRYDQCLLKSRWEGFDIGSKDETSVFILLVDDGQDVPEQFEVKSYFHVAWGMIRPRKSGE
jgi:hypothetical protein